VLLAGFILSGCTSVPLTKYAKAQELVTIPLGGSKTVANSNYLKTTDVAVTVTDSLGQVFPAAIHNLYRVFPDPSSRYALVTKRSDNELTSNSIVYANEGQWMLQFIMPTTNTYGEALEPGMAQISVVSTEAYPDSDPKKRRINTDPRSYNDDLADMPIEILPGTVRSLSTAEYFGGGYLANGATIITSPDDESLLANNVGGAVFVYEYATASFHADGIPYALKSSPDQNIQLITRREDAGGGLTRLTAMVLSPKGFFDDVSWTPGTSYYDGLHIALSWDNGIQGNNTVMDANWQSHIALVAAESYYIDLDGNAIGGVSPVLNKVR